ncbi:hypothetical protein PQX77_000887 [Marasmius sp. AFHP31]|nr:hypothetical protein PQX77_000887 [Marasmius sp. AFHP31]
MSTIREPRIRPYVQDVTHAVLELTNGKARSIHVPQIYRTVKKNADINPLGPNARSSQKKGVEKLISRGLLVPCGKQKVKLSEKARELLLACRSSVGVEPRATPAREQWVRITKMMDEQSRPPSQKRSSGQTVTQLRAENRKTLKDCEDLKTEMKALRLELEATKHILSARDDLTLDRPLTPLSDDEDDDEERPVDHTEEVSAPHDQPMEVDSDSDDDERFHAHLFVPSTPPPARPIHAPIPTRGPPGFLPTRSGSMRNVQTGRVTPARTVGPSSPPASRVYDEEESSQMTMVDDAMTFDDSIRPPVGTSSGHLPTPDTTPERPVRSSSHSSVLTIVNVKDKTIQDLEEQLAESRSELKGVQSQLANALKELAEFKTSTETLGIEVTDLRQESQQLKEAKLQITSLTASLVARDAEVASLKADANTLQGQITDLTASEAQATRELEAANDIIEPLRSELSASKRSYVALLNDKAIVDGDFIKTTTRLTEVERVKAVLEAQAFGRQVESDNMVYKAERDKADLQEQFDERLDKVTQKSGTKIKQLKGQLKRSRKSLADAEQTISRVMRGAIQELEDPSDSDSDSEESRPRKRKRASY